MVNAKGKRQKLTQEDHYLKLKKQNETQEYESECSENLESNNFLSNRYYPLFFDSTSDQSSSESKKSFAIENQKKRQVTSSGDLKKDLSLDNIQEKVSVQNFSFSSSEIVKNINEKKHNTSYHFVEESSGTKSVSDATKQLTFSTENDNFDVNSTKKSSISVGVNTEKELLFSGGQTNIDLVPNIKFTVLGRFPFLSLVQCDGTFTNNLIIFAEIHTLCSVIQTIRIRFSETLTNIISLFLKPNDEIEIKNFQVNFKDLLTENFELNLGVHLKESSLIIDRKTDKKNEISKKTSRTHETIITITRPSIEGSIQNPFTCFFSSVSGSCLHYDEIPDWAQHSHCEKEIAFSDSFELQDMTDDCKQNKILQEKQFSNFKSRYKYLELVSLTNSAYSCFYGCVVEVSKSIRPHSLPKYGRVCVMNVDIVDPSIAATFRSSLLSNNPAKVNVSLITRNQSSMPFIAVGDIIRVHRSRLSVHQDFKSGNVFLDTNNLPNLTSISLWRLYLFVNETDGISAKSDEMYLRKEKTKKKRILIRYWKSEPLLSQNSEESKTAKQSRGTPLDANDNHMLKKLSNWSYESLSECQCFANVYFSTLSRLSVCGQLNRYVDIIVKVLDIEREEERLSSSLFGINSSNFDMFHDSGNSLSFQMSSSATTDSSVRVPFNDSQKGFGDEPQLQPNMRFRLKVTDHSTASERCSSDIWVVSKFSTYSSYYIESHVKVGDWLRVRNVAFVGVKRLEASSKFFKSDTCETEVYLLDGFRAKVTLLPPFVKELQLPTFYS